MAKVMYDRSGSYRSRSSSYSRNSETGSNDARYKDANRENIAYNTEEVRIVQPSTADRRGPESLETDHSVQRDPARIPRDLDRSYSETTSYDARYKAANRAYEAEDVHLINPPDRRGRASIETDSVQSTDPAARIPRDLDRSADVSKPKLTYDARYINKANRTYSDTEEVRLLQPDRRGPSSLGTGSVQTDYSQIPMGLDIFVDTDRFVIRQIYQSEAWWDTLRFQVEDGRGKPILEIRQEKDDNSCIQAILSKMRQYFMKVYDVNSNECIIEFEHPWSCLTPIFCPWASPSMIVRMATGEVLGYVKNASRETCGSCLPPTKYFEVLNYEEAIINAVTGPTCYPFECTRSSPAIFELLKVEKSGKTMQVGDITHQWRGCCGGVASCCFTEEKESVTITFPKECQVEDKALFLSLGFLVLFTFFEVN